MDADEHMDDAWRNASFSEIRFKGKKGMERDGTGREGKACFTGCCGYRSGDHAHASSP